MTKLSTSTKPWITPALRKSISIKNNLLKNDYLQMILEQNEDITNIKITETCYLQFWKKVKETTAVIFFESNWNNIKNT